MESVEVESLFGAAFAEARDAGPDHDTEIARRYAERLAPESQPEPMAHLGTARVVELVCALLAGVLGLSGIVYAARQFAAATALYGFYPAGSHGRLVLAVFALFCLGVGAGAVLHAILRVSAGLFILVPASVALILASAFGALYTGPGGMTVEYTTLIPSGEVSLLCVSTAAFAAVAAVSALADGRNWGRV